MCLDATLKLLTLPVCIGSTLQITLNNYVILHISWYIPLATTTTLKLHGYTMHQQCWTLFITNWCT